MTGRMTRGFPVVSTVIVALAVAVMIGLGFWQIDRLHQKQTLIARYQAATADPTVHPWPAAAPGPAAYSRVRADCQRMEGISAQAGESVSHRAGWAQVADCTFAGEARARVVLGWAARLAPVRWSGGAVEGTLVDKGKGGMVIVADPPLAGLESNAKPDPRDLPNNHLSYAVQWFLFAATALVIYGLALRKWMRGK